MEIRETRPDRDGLSVVLNPSQPSTHPALAVTQADAGPGIRVVSDSTTSPAVCASGGTGIAVRSTPGARQPVIQLGSDGSLSWGSGSAPVDASVTRTGAGAIQLDADVTITGIVHLAGGTSIQRAVWKTADETVNNSDVLQDDDDLVLTVGANATFLVDGMLINSAAPGADLKIAFTGPAGATLAWVPRGLAASAASTSGEVTLAASTIGDGGALVTGTAGAGTKVTTLVTGLLIVGATAGSLQLRWAQNVADASDCVVHVGSYLQVRQVS